MFINGNPNAETRLKAFSHIFSFFSYMLHLNQKVDIIIEKGLTFAACNTVKRQINLERLESFSSFRDFFSRLQKAAILEFQLDNVLKNKTNKIFIKHDYQKQQYINYSEDKFGGNNEELRDKCQTIALKILQKSDINRINLLEFKQIVSWVKFLWEKPYNDDIQITDEKIDLYVAKLKDLLYAVKQNKNENHKFVNHCSAAYHTNAHFGHLKSFHKLKNIPRYLGSRYKKKADANFLLFLNEVIDVDTEMLDENEQLDEPTLNKCVRFYLHAAANFIFHKDRYRFCCEKTKLFHYRLDNIGGIKTGQNHIQRGEFAITIRPLKPSEVQIDKRKPSLANQDPDWRKR